MNWDITVAQSQQVLLFSSKHLEVDSPNGRPEDLRE
jgi:hypothetical protein